VIFHNVHNCACIFWFTSRNIENAKMGFFNQLNMFFHIMISYTCDMHLKLEILSLMDIKKLANFFIRESFPLQPFASKF
jgi:hypothetical protein